MTTHPMDRSALSQDVSGLAWNKTGSQKPADLAAVVTEFAASANWLDRVRLRADQRWYERLYLGEEYDVWVISWMPGQSTGYHDHGSSSGAFVVTTGLLEEHRPGTQARAVAPGRVRAFGVGYAHDVRNVSDGPAVSIHAYSPPLTEMNEFELEGGQLIPRADGKQSVRGTSEWRQVAEDHHHRNVVQSIDEALSAARGRLQRLSPREAFAAALTGGAVLVDIRPDGQRALEGSIPDALLVERNVLEWRFDPTCDSRLPVAVNHDVQVIVFCSEGYTSSLAAAALQDLGLWRATDIAGGMKAWRAEGLPVAAGGKDPIT